MVSVASLSDWLFILIIVMSIKAEKHYVSRASRLANTIAIFSSTAHHWDIAPWPLQWYSSIGLFFGGLAFLSYMWGSKMDPDFYWVTWILYNSIIATLYVLIAGFYS